MRLGEWDVRSQSEFFKHVESRVARIVLHPDYDKANLVNDLAVIRLEKPIDFVAK